jgi:hypothetical protein
MIRVAVGFLVLCALVAVASGARAHAREGAGGLHGETAPMAAGLLIPNPGVAAHAPG